MRNRLYTYKQYVLKLPLWFFKDLKYVAKELLKIILVEQDKLKKIKMMVYGFRDALVGKKGVYK